MLDLLWFRELRFFKLYIKLSNTFTLQDLSKLTRFFDEVVEDDRKEANYEKLTIYMDRMAIGTKGKDSATTRKLDKIKQVYKIKYLDVHFIEVEPDYFIKFENIYDLLKNHCEGLYHNAVEKVDLVTSVIKSWFYLDPFSREAYMWLGSDIEL